MIKESVAGGDRYIVPVSADEWDSHSKDSDYADASNMDDYGQYGISKATWGASIPYFTVPSIENDGRINPLHQEMDSFEV